MRIYVITAIVGAALVCATTSGCQLLGEQASSLDGVIVRSGEQFGFCVGYCFRELELADSKQILTTKANPFDPRDNSPTLTNEWPLGRATADSLDFLIDRQIFKSLDEVYGCPDCADGGSEWIEIEFAPGEKSRVTFEFGKSVEEIDGLVRFLRQLRSEAIARAEKENEVSQH